MKKILLTACAILTGLSLSAKPLPKAVYELKLATGTDLMNTEDIKDFPVEFGLGYNLQKNWLVGGFFSYSKREWESYFGANGVWEIGAYTEYSFFMTERLRPYISFSASLLDGQDSDADMVLNVAPGAGAKFFLTENLSIFAECNLNIATEEIYDFERKQTSDGDWPTALGSGESFNISMTAGLRYLLF